MSLKVSISGSMGWRCTDPSQQMNPANLQTAYDRIPYQSGPFPQTHPDRLATLGNLFGMYPAPVDNCRVLELGCAGGGNLIPMAFHLPDSEFIGIDASRRQIDTSRKTIRDLALDNIHLEHRDILDLDGSIGSFDFIITHGVYSWVPNEVQEKILSIAAEYLNPQGIAYVSYNTYPGWHMREMIRRMMLFHIEPFDTPEKRIEQARALMGFLSSSVPTANNHFGMMLKEELDLIRRVNDWYLFHDHLEEINSPIYFHQFNDRARRHGLQYLGEAEFSTMLSMGFSKEITAILDRISPDIIRAEQYMDFIRNRQFRQTLLCHDSVSLKRELEAEDAAVFLFASSTRPRPDPPNLTPDVQHSFKTNTGLTITTSSSMTKAALCSLYTHWPRAIDVDTLFLNATSLLAEHGIQTGATNAESRIELLKDMLHCYAQNVVEFHTWQANSSNKISEYPKVGRLAAYLANGSPVAVNQRHETVALDPVAHQMTGMLDGTKNHAQVTAALIDLVASGDLVIKQGDLPLKDSGKIKQTIENVMEQTLRFMCRSAMLVA